MYINYEKIGEKLGFGKEFFYNLKVKQNLKYIEKNQKRVLKKLKNKTHLNVVFYVYDESKWKSQSVYELMEKDERFNPLIVVTKNCAVEGNANYQTEEDVKRCYKFFKNKGMRVEYGYSITNTPHPNPPHKGRGEQFCLSHNTPQNQREQYCPYSDTQQKEKEQSAQNKDFGFIPFESFAPDIIIYSHPWYVYKTQGPVVCSKFALTFYIPYFIPASEQWHEYGLRFHQYLFRHYVPTDLVKDFYSKNMPNRGKSLKTVGHPILDNYANNQQKEKKYIIYAPHWTVCGDNLRFGTFDWSGQKILDFAKSHSELNWVFRPHPLLYKFMMTSGFMKHEDIDKYYNEWKNIGIFSEGGDYTDLFNKSYCMITDCGSFLTEYFVTENPVIHLISDKFKPNPTIKEIDKTYYTAHNIDEMYKYLEDVILNKNDYKKQERRELLTKLNLNSTSSAKRIIDDILGIIYN